MLSDNIPLDDGLFHNAFNVPWFHPSIPDAMACQRVAFGVFRLVTRGKVHDNIPGEFMTPNMADQAYPCRIHLP